MAGNDGSLAAAFLLTRNAALGLRRIHAWSRREWGEDVADRTSPICMRRWALLPPTRKRAACGNTVRLRF